MNETDPIDKSDSSDKSDPSDAPPESVILLHGLGRSRLSMWVLGARLRSAGFETHNFPYSPPTQTLDEIATDLREFVEKRVAGGRYHFISHSLGGVVIRHGFKKGYPPRLGRIVMLAPPNDTPQLAVALKGNWLFDLISGDSGRRMADPAFYDSLPVPDVEFGVIAGDRGQNLTFDAPNDGVVTVEGARLEGMADWTVVRRTHTFLMNSADAARLCVNFLRSGAFEGKGDADVSTGMRNPPFASPSQIDR